MGENDLPGVTEVPRVKLVVALNLKSGRSDPAWLHDPVPRGGVHLVGVTPEC